MNDQIYVKFAEALDARRQQRRHAAVVFKFAAAIDARCQKKLAEVQAVKSAQAVGQTLVDDRSARPGRLTRRERIVRRRTGPAPAAAASPALPQAAPVTPQEVPVAPPVSVPQPGTNAVPPQATQPTPSLAPKPAAVPAPSPMKPKSEWDITPVERFHNVVKPYLNPTGITGGVLAGLGGLMAAQSAIGGGSFLRRLLQMLLGGAMAYGGYRLAKSPTAAAAVNPYVSRFLEKFGPQAIK